MAHRPSSTILDTAHAGCVDGNLWYILGHYAAWPFIGGFYVAALVQAGRLEAAERQLVKLAQMNREGKKEPWEFNEWFHGLSGRPMGYARQSWSMALYIFAHEAVTQGHVPIWNAQDGWAAEDDVSKF